MRISTKGRYALRVMLDLAEQGRAGYVPLREIAQRQEISEKYLEAIIKALSQGGLVEGLRGKNGGYRLGVEPGACTVGSVLKCAEGSLAPVACLDCREEKACPRSAQCRTLPMWQELDRRIDAYLESVTLQDLLEQERG